MMAAAPVDDDDNDNSDDEEDDGDEECACDTMDCSRGDGSSEGDGGVKPTWGSSLNLVSS